MRTILLDVSFPTTVDQIDPILESPLGRGAFSRRAAQKRPLLRFNIGQAANAQAQAESVRELASFSGGHEPIFFDGDSWAEIVTPVLVWIGVGGDTVEYILPYKNVFPPSCVIFENGVIKSDWQMPDDGVSGITVFDTAPAEGSEITFKGIRKIKGVLMIRSEQAVYSSTEIGPRIFQESLQFQEVA